MDTWEVILNEDEEGTDEFYPVIDSEDIMKIIMIFVVVIGLIGLARLTDLRIQQIERDLAELHTELPPEWSAE